MDGGLGWSVITAGQEPRYTPTLPLKSPPPFIFLPFFGVKNLLGFSLILIRWEPKIIVQGKVCGIVWLLRAEYVGAGAARILTALPTAWHRLKGLIALDGSKEFLDYMEYITGIWIDGPIRIGRV